MKRTQLYIDNDLWKVLEIRAHESGSSVSELVRQTLRERYFDKTADRASAMRALVGVRHDRPELADSAEYVRSLRRGSRLDRMGS